MKHKLLLVDDDKEVLGINKTYFEEEGYLVAAATSVKEAMAYMKQTTFSCIVLDVMMPHVDGLTFCKTIRKYSDVPIIFLSGNVEEEDRINGLLLGADDYLTKPFSLRELSVRIGMHIRRHEASRKASNSSSLLEFPPMVIDVLSHKVFWNEEEIPLSNKEFVLLHLLAGKAEEPCTFEEIGEAIWGSYIDSDRRSIMVIVSRLRKKLENYTSLDHIIESVWSKGYRFTIRSSGKEHHGKEKI